jgi:hypothetical protein
MRSCTCWAGNEAIVVSFIVFSCVHTERLKKQSGNSLHSELYLYYKELDPLSPNRRSCADFCVLRVSERPDRLQIFHSL